MGHTCVLYVLNVMYRKRGNNVKKVEQCTESGVPVEQCKLMEVPKVGPLVTYSFATGIALQMHYTQQLGVCKRACLPAASKEVVQITWNLSVDQRA